MTSCFQRRKQRKRKEKKLKSVGSSYRRKVIVALCLVVAFIKFGGFSTRKTSRTSGVASFLKRNLERCRTLCIKSVGLESSLASSAVDMLIRKDINKENDRRHTSQTGTGVSRVQRPNRLPPLIDTLVGTVDDAGYYTSNGGVSTTSNADAYMKGSLVTSAGRRNTVAIAAAAAAAAVWSERGGRHRMKTLNDEWEGALRWIAEWGVGDVSGDRAQHNSNLNSKREAERILQKAEDSCMDQCLELGNQEENWLHRNHMLRGFYAFGSHMTVRNLVNALLLPFPRKEDHQFIISSFIRAIVSASCLWLIRAFLHRWLNHPTKIPQWHLNDSNGRSVCQENDNRLKGKKKIGGKKGKKRRQKRRVACHPTDKISECTYSIEDISDSSLSKSCHVDNRHKDPSEISHDGQILGSFVDIVHRRNANHSKEQFAIVKSEIDTFAPTILCIHPQGREDEIRQLPKSNKCLTSIPKKSPGIISSPNLSSHQCSFDSPEVPNNFMESSLKITGDEILAHSEPSYFSSYNNGKANEQGMEGCCIEGDPIYCHNYNVSSKIIQKQQRVTFPNRLEVSMDEETDHVLTQLNGLPVPTDEQREEASRLLREFQSKQIAKIIQKRLLQSQKTCNAHTLPVKCQNAQSFPWSPKLLLPSSIISPPPGIRKDLDDISLHASEDCLSGDELLLSNILEDDEDECATDATNQTSGSSSISTGLADNVNWSSSISPWLPLQSQPGGKRDFSSLGLYDFIKNKKEGHESELWSQGDSMAVNNSSWGLSDYCGTRIHAEKMW